VTDALISVDRLLAEGAAELRAAGLPAARREARRLWGDLREAAGGDRPSLEPATASAAQAAGFRAAVVRRAAGEPLPYVTGLTGFRRLTLRCDRRALIPRPETEGLVELVLAHQPNGRIADIGTGSGCIALALADEGQYQLVLGLDRSADALGLAAENRERTGLAVELARGDLAGPLGGGRLDAIVSNPPYLTDAEFAGLDSSVRDWEPGEALASGRDGLEATRAVVVGGLVAARPGGWLALEVDATRAESVAQLVTASGWRDAAIHRDLFGRARYVLARRIEAE
jgi:release factor glutamine methyltransferase